MKDLGRRIEAVEDRLGSADDGPRELRVIVSEHTFGTREELRDYTRQREQENRRRGHESIDTLRVTVVSIGDPHTRDLGELRRAPVKMVRS